MSTYKNSYFGLYIEFSEGWRCQSWSNWKREPDDNGSMQRYDDDLPRMENEYKSLFLANHRMEKSPSLFSSRLSVDIYWSKNELDLNSKAPYRENQISRKFETGNLFGQKAQIRTIEHDCDSYVLIHKVIAWKAKPNLWLSACISGDNSESFEEANIQFNKLIYGVN